MPQKTAPAEYKTVRGLTRGLAILNAMNRAGHSVGASELGALTGLHRTTVKRLLETLKDEGYVRCSQSDGRWLLDMKVRELAEGFRDEEWISSVAAPLLGGLLRIAVWPSDILTFDVDEMVVRETTHRFSRLSFYRSMVGWRVPMLVSASGRAYLAFCPDAEREQIIALLAKRRKDENCQLARDPVALESTLRRTRRMGYATNYMEWTREKHIAALALPIRGENRLLGCLNVTFQAKAMSLKEAAERYLPAMRDVADSIESSTAAQSTHASG